MRSEEGFTLLEMLLVLGIASILLGVFALPAALRDRGAGIQLETIRAVGEFAQCKAAAAGQEVTLRFHGNAVDAAGHTLVLSEELSCASHAITFYPQLSSAPAQSVRFGQEEGKTLVFQLGRGRSDVR